MRFLRYGEDGHGLTLDFHPDVTVVSGLRSIEEARIVHTLRAAIAGRAVEVALEVEVDGERIVLEPGDRIPGANIHALDCIGQAEQLAEFAVETDSSVADSARRLKAADRAVLVLEESAAATRAQHDQLSAERHRVENEIEIVGLRIEAMRAETDEQRIMSMASTQIEHLRSHVDYLRELPVDELVHASEALHLAVDPTPMTDPRAAALADRWADVASRAAALEARLSSEGRSPDEFASRMEAAQRAVVEEEAPLRPGSIDRTIADQLEAAHEEVIEAESKRRRFLGSKSAKRLDEAVAKEQVFLDQLGFTTWTGYVMGTVGMDSGDRAERLRVAQDELAAIQAEWDAVTAELAADPEYSALFEEMDQVYTEAIELIGWEPADDIEVTLRDIVIEPDPNADPDALAFQVVGALRRVGVSIDDGMDHDDLSERAERVIESLAEGAAVADEQAEQADRIEAMMRRVEDDGESIDDLAVELGDELSTDTAALEARVEELAEEIAALDGRLTEIEELVVARLTLRDTAVAATRKIAIEVLDAVAEAGALSEAAQVEYLAHRLRTHLEDEDVLPLVLDHAFAGFTDLTEVLDLIEGQRGVVQTILVTSRPDLSAWAAELGDTNALVISP
jgi:hypothetical protein